MGGGGVGGWRGEVSLSKLLVLHSEKKNGPTLKGRICFPL